MNALGIPHWKFKFSSLSLTVYKSERVPNTAHYDTLNARFSKLFFFYPLHRITLQLIIPSLSVGNKQNIRCDISRRL